MTNPKHTDTSRSGHLVAAMKDQLESWEFEDPREDWWKWQHQYAQAADRIEALSAENERIKDRLGWICAVMDLDDDVSLQWIYTELEALRGLGETK